MPFEIDPLLALSAIDGRYRRTAAKLAPYLSEYALIVYRVEMQTEYLIALSEGDDVPLRTFTREEKARLRDLQQLSLEDAGIIKDIEVRGYAGIPKTNHDVVAVIMWLREKLRETSLADVSEWVHFGLTSEDCNNIAYALMLRAAVRQVLHPAMVEVLREFERFANQYANLPMLARTHGQAATPTTLGKEFRVWRDRLGRQLKQLEGFKILVKLNGASGNYCAHVAALPEIDWQDFSRYFATSFNDGDGAESLPLRFQFNPLTTQIEPHDTYAELFGIIARFNTILVDACQDIWRYVSDDWLVQKAEAGEVGSSAMPQKVNPINFENAEGNLQFANAMLEFFVRKLPISRLQRDLSDSTVERDFGLAFGHCLKAYEEVKSGFGKISANEKKIVETLAGHPEVLAEAYQTILRRAGIPDAYNTLKEITRGKPVTYEDLGTFIHSVGIPEEIRKELSALTPETYIGLASRLAQS